MTVLPQFIRGRSNLTCQELVELVTNYLDDALAPREQARFERHIAGCPNCTEYLAQMRATIRATGRLRSEDLTPEMRDEFTALYRAWRSEEE